MALTDAQMQAMQEAKDIDTGVDTRTKEERTKEQMDALKSIGKGALFSPVTGAADIVDIGASMPDPKSGTEFMFPKYSALKETFDQLSDSGINRENVVKIIKDETGIELKGDAPELIGEIVGLPAIAATKVATALFKAVGKSADEAKQLFRTASGGDDFDGMATAVAGDVKAQTDQLITKTDLPDTSISPNMIGLETPQGRAAVKEYTVLQSKSPNITNDELFYRTGVYKGKDGKFRYELDTTNAKLNSKSFKLKKVTDNVSGASVLSNRITLNTKDATLGNILNFDDLYQAYSKQSSIPIKGDAGFKIFKPLKNIKVVRLEDAPFPTRDTTQAAYSAADDTIYIGDASNYQELLSSILHEVQHAIQRREGFITGSDSSRFLPRNFDEKYAEVKKSVRVLQNKAKKQPKDTTLKNALGTARRRMTRMKTQLQEANINYMKKYGEIEARNVEYRKKLRTEYKAEGMSDEEIAEKLRLITPEETQTYKGEPIATQDTFDERDEFRKVLRAHDPDRQPAAKSVREGYNPEDPASRVFHLTKKDYDVADVIGSGINSDIGFHVGTAAQATARGSTNIRYDKELAEEMVKGERILPLVLKENLKPARIPDVSSFKEPTRWIRDMSVAKSDKQRIKFLLDNQSDADLLAKAPKVTVGGDTYFMLPDVMRIGMDEKLWKDIILEAHRAERIGLDTVVNQDDRVEWFNTLKRTANKNGYDSFVYRNEYEGAATENIDALVEQIQRAQRGEIDSNEIDLSSRFSDSYMLLEPNQAKGLFGGMTESDPRYMKNKGGLMLQKGGAIPMDRQMSMFDEGGLEDDGGTIDPVSGNKVPPGSSKEEVRDDIPAQLSEGEFVFPADVVRYIGLEKLMRLRQEAKMGLKMMEEMGQMGNADEATIPDDLPFGMMDLIIVDSEDEEEYNNKKEKAEGGLAMQEGGVVTPQDAGIFYQPSQFAGQDNRPGVAAPAPDAASRQFVQQPQQAATPTVKYEQPQTTFEDFLKPQQGGPQTITIVNKETGEKELITFIPGVTKIKEGFVREEDYVPKEIVPETETARVETATVAPETGGDDEARQRREEEMFGPGGGRLGFKGQGEGVDLSGKPNDLIFGVSFDGINPLTGGKSILAGLTTDGVIPEKIAGDVTVNFKRADVEFSMTGVEYNDIKKTMQRFGSGSSQVRDKLNEYGYEEAKEKARLERMGFDTKTIDFGKRMSKKAEEERAAEAAKEGTFQRALEKAQKLEGPERERAFGTALPEAEARADIEKGGSGFTRGSIIDRAVREAQDMVDSGYFDENRGGLMSNKKLAKDAVKKVTKKKRGGLASKK